MNHIMKATTDARRPNFTVAELRRAGPMFNPMHPLCQERKKAMRANTLAREVLEKRDELWMVYRQAQLASDRASAALYRARTSALAEHEAECVRRQRELDVLHAHDMLWTSQRLLQLWDFTYGPQALGISS